MPICEVRLRPARICRSRYSDKVDLANNRECWHVEMVQTIDDGGEECNEGGVAALTIFSEKCSWREFRKRPRQLSECG